MFEPLLFSFLFLFFYFSDITMYIQDETISIDPSIRYKAAVFKIVLL
jgi:hypothetical protein